jgi:hypothetical protein
MQACFIAMHLWLLKWSEEGRAQLEHKYLSQVAAAYVKQVGTVVMKASVASHSIG